MGQSEGLVSRTERKHHGKVIENRKMTNSTNISRPTEKVTGRKERPEKNEKNLNRMLKSAEKRQMRR